MSAILAVILLLLSGYFIGSFPTSYIITRMTRGIDIRDVGSGNAGATNVLRAAGSLPAVITLAVDILKGVLVATMITDFFYFLARGVDFDLFRSLGGLSVVCGHIWPVFLKFRGGKGVATTLGVAAVIAPMILIPSLLVWLLVFFLTSYVSLASILALMAFPVIAVIVGTPFSVTAVSILICFIVIYKHKSNIYRLLKGEENRTRIFKN